MKLSLLLAGILSLNLCFAQSFDISGKVVDDKDEALALASVVLLNPADSIMQSFTVSNTMGEYKLKKIKPGDYILQVAFIGYNTYSTKIDVESNDLNVGSITLNEVTELLDEVAVSAERIPILIKGDTIEYNADAFKTNPNSSVEELLKRLPGIEVDQDGNIKAQGEEINKVLVDGKEFFGNDPKIATKNLPADAINKVQVFDKMSEMAEFTGVDDGQRAKTINLDLKEDKKKGIFGKISGGYGTDSRHKSKANLNKFNKTTQLSFLGASNNVNEQNFSFQDYLNAAGGLSALTSGGSGMITSESLEGLAMGGEQGVTTATSAGLNFNHDFSKNTEWNSSYFFNHIDNDLDRRGIRQNFLNGDIFTAGDTSLSSRRNMNHRFNFKLKHTLKEGQDLTLRSNISFNTGNDNLLQFNRTFDQAGTLINQSDNKNHGNLMSGRVSTSLLYRRKLNDLGRSLTAKGVFGYSSNINEQNVLATTGIFSGTEQQFILDQFQESNNDELDYEFDVSLTEPVGKGKFLTLNYERRNFDTNNEALFFNNISGERVIDNQLSQSFNRDYYYDRGGIKFQYNTDDLKLTLASKLQGSSLSGNVADEGLNISRTFLNVLPMMYMRYSIDNSKYISANYNTSVNEPQLRQLQPVVNNSNPLSQYIGNPNLKVEYNHNASVSFSLFDNFSFTNLFIRLNGRLIQNRITNSTIIAEDFTQVITPINIDKEWVGNGYTSFGTSIKPLGIKFNISSNHEFLNTELFINEGRNTLERWTNGIDVRVENRKKTRLDIAAGYKREFTTTRYSEDSNLDQDFFRTVIYSDLSITIKKKWVLSSSMDYRIFDGDAFEEVLEVPIWRASISRTFLNADRGELKLSVFDILNENRGISRSSNFNFVQDTRVNTVSQYVMLSFTYSLSKFGDGNNGIIVKEQRSR